jgi:hypothetical protein
MQASGAGQLLLSSWKSLALACASAVTRSRNWLWVAPGWWPMLRIADWCAAAPLQVLQYVQDPHSLVTCLPLLEGLLSSCSETSRNLAVVKALRRGENLQVGCRGLSGADGLGWALAGVRRVPQDPCM